ncbi:MAG: VWA domain-containing protein [Eubacterium sp.]|nr:VWA domain-containing protein [Eubacterium sp.]
MDSSYLKYNVDMVFCIDATGSMGPVIRTVKQNALNFYKDVRNSMEMKQKSINTLRVRLIIFRDYIADQEDAMLVSRFFVLPDEQEEFSEAVKSITATGGGDIPEDGLEALGYAIRSPWNPEGVIGRSVIVVWTDTSTHELGFGASAPNYPRNMAANFEELTEWWGDEQIPSPYIKNSSKRLILFAPEENWWTNITESWNNVIHYPSVAGAGLKEMTYREIIDAISNSI